MNSFFFTFVFLPTLFVTQALRSDCLSIEELMDSTTYASASISKQGDKVLLASNADGIYNAYEIDVKTEQTRQLSFEQNNSVLTIGYLHDESRYLAMMDQGGNELYHIYLVEHDKFVDLTPTPNSRSLFHQWSPDRRKFYYLSNARDARHIDLYVYDLEKHKSKLLFKNSAGFEFGPVSASERYLALTEINQVYKNHIYIYDTRLDKITKVTKQAEKTSYHPLCFNQKGTELYYSTDQDSDFEYLCCFHMKSRRHQKVYETHWDITSAKLSPKENYLHLVVNENSQSTIYLLNRKTLERVKLPEYAHGAISSVTFSEDESKLFFFVTSSKLPNDLFVIDWHNQTIQQLTHSLNPKLDPNALVQGQVISYPSFDGLDIPAILYEPDTPTDKALVFVHGGPGGQSTLSYNPFFQYLISHGYTILAVNNRGSSGYGKTFYRAADQKQGSVDLQDCVYGKHFLVEQLHIPQDRIGIMGSSYGGYMTLAALTFTPDVFCVGIDFFGFSNWIRTLSNLPAYWTAGIEGLYKRMGHPIKDYPRLVATSPLFFAHQIQKPLLIVHGNNDPRILKEDCEELIEALESRHIPHQLLLFEDEGHGFSKTANAKHAYAQTLQFLETYLGTSHCGQALTNAPPSCSAKCQDSLPH